MFKENILKGKKILVTGGGTGLGREMSEHYVKHGAELVICGRRESVLVETANEFKDKYGANVRYQPLDIRSPQDVEDFIDSIFQEGPLHGLVNNAAGNFISPTERLSTRAFDAVIDIVLKGTINFTLTLGKKWIKDKSDGNVLNIVTTYSWTGSGYVVPSACAKAGVLSMTRSLAVEWAKYKIRSNAIAPGPFPTKGAWERLLPGDLKEKFDPSKKVPVGRVGEHQELSNLAAYLLSDYSSYINGEVITIDGAEWLKGAGQFNHLEMITDQMWDMFEMMRKKK